MNSDQSNVDQGTVELFGGSVQEIDLNDDGLEVQIALRNIRDSLMAIAERENIGINQLARRLDISPSSVSRFFSNEGDIRVSTAVLYARALGYLWSFGLCPDSACVERGNYNVRPKFFDIRSATSTCGAVEQAYQRPVTNLPVGTFAYGERKLQLKAIP